MHSPLTEPQFVPVTAADQPALFDLMQKIYPPVYAYLWPDGGQWYLESQYGKENFDREMADDRADYRFIFHGGIPVGIVRSVRDVSCPDCPEEPATKLHRLYLDPATHGRGFGKQAVKRLLNTCRRRGDRCLWLEAMDSAESSLAFYVGTGFSRGGHFTLDMPRMYPAQRGMYRYYRMLD
ncbi:RimJ/RimL family protein N-acetyltransferase [Neolewinella xylanilytica]|uniref:RimJ/RimL family protein N-acetyltransferase n=1 Tax=Neolewinella xylanilytica TaxID=1514080 RepID=A0A2S6I2D3_9BACT|nr:GNAT family N-acetyltransferase [Neolewinella xylanilytica]PPK85337.1 RimJ/RimL family protein N-acetyltransferase [Neolewinella xylanilytica]